MRILDLAIAVVISLAVGAGVGSWYTRDNLNSKHQLEIKTLNEKAERRLSEVTAKKDKLETQLTLIRKDLEVEYESTINSQKHRIDELLAANGRLRDPGNKGSRNTCPTDTRAPSSDATVDAPEGLLSDEATRFLFQFAGEADEILEQLRTCKAWSNSVKKELDAYKDSVESSNRH